MAAYESQLPLNHPDAQRLRLLRLDGSAQLLDRQVQAGLNIAAADAAASQLRYAHGCDFTCNTAATCCDKVKVTQLLLMLLQASPGMSLAVTVQ